MASHVYIVLLTRRHGSDPTDLMNTTEKPFRQTTLQKAIAAAAKYLLADYATLLTEDDKTKIGRYYSCNGNNENFKYHHEFENPERFELSGSKEEKTSDVKKVEYIKWIQARVVAYYGPRICPATNVKTSLGLGKWTLQVTVFKPNFPKTKYVTRSIETKEDLDSLIDGLAANFFYSLLPEIDNGGTMEPDSLQTWCCGGSLFSYNVKVTKRELLKKAQALVNQGSVPMAKDLGPIIYPQDEYDSFPWVNNKEVILRVNIKWEKTGITNGAASRAAISPSLPFTPTMSTTSTTTMTSTKAGLASAGNSPLPSPPPVSNPSPTTHSVVGAETSPDQVAVPSKKQKNNDSAPFKPSNPTTIFQTPIVTSEHLIPPTKFAADTEDRTNPPQFGSSSIAPTNTFNPANWTFANPTSPNMFAFTPQIKVSRQIPQIGRENNFNNSIAPEGSGTTPFSKQHNHDAQARTVSTSPPAVVVGIEKEEEQDLDPMDGISEGVIEPNDAEMNEPEPARFECTTPYETPTPYVQSTIPELPRYECSTPYETFTPYTQYPTAEPPRFECSTPYAAFTPYAQYPTAEPPRFECSTTCEAFTHYNQGPIWELEQQELEQPAQEKQDSKHTEPEHPKQQYDQKEFGQQEPKQQQPKQQGVEQPEQPEPEHPEHLEHLEQQNFEQQEPEEPEPQQPEPEHPEQLEHLQQQHSEQQEPEQPKQPEQPEQPENQQLILKEQELEHQLLAEQPLLEQLHVQRTLIELPAITEKQQAIPAAEPAPIISSKADKIYAEAKARIDKFNARAKAKAIHVQQQMDLIREREKAETAERIEMVKRVEKIENNATKKAQVHDIDIEEVWYDALDDEGLEALQDEELVWHDAVDWVEDARLKLEEALLKKEALKARWAAEKEEEMKIKRYLPIPLPGISERRKPHGGIRRRAIAPPPSKVKPALSEEEEERELEEARATFIAQCKATLENQKKSIPRLKAQTEALQRLVLKPRRRYIERYLGISSKA